MDPPQAALVKQEMVSLDDVVFGCVMTSANDSSNANKCWIVVVWNVVVLQPLVCTERRLWC